jgi:hypothetical protein
MNDIVEVIQIDKIIPYEFNARTHEKFQLNQIAASIKRYGFICPIADFLQYRTGLGLDVVTSIASGLARRIGNAIIRNGLTHSRSFVKAFDGHKLFPQIGSRKVCSSIARQ